MKKLFILTFCLFCFSFSPACEFWSYSKANDWRELTLGLSYKNFAYKPSSLNVKIHAFKIDLNKMDIRPIVPPKASIIKNMALNNRALVAINANFFDETKQILGLVTKQKEILHPFKKVSWWSVFCQKNRSSTIVHSSQYTKGMCENAIQAGPRLVVNGKIPQLKDEISRKSAIGINSKGQVILVMINEPIPIKELAQIFYKEEKSGGLGCKNALNLDGGSSSQIYSHVKDFTLDIPGFVTIPVGLGVFSKK